MKAGPARVSLVLAVLAGWLAIPSTAIGAAAAPVTLGVRPNGVSSLPPTGRLLQRFTAANKSSAPMTANEAVALARANDVISAHPAMFSPYRAGQIR